MIRATKKRDERIQHKLKGELGENSGKGSRGKSIKQQSLGKLTGVEGRENLRSG